MEFNVDGEAKGKPGLAGIGGMLHNSDGLVLAKFSKHMGCMKSNEGEVVPIFEALHVFVSSFKANLAVESDSTNPISWLSSLDTPNWRFQFYLMIL